MTTVSELTPEQRAGLIVRLRLYADQAEVADFAESEFSRDMNAAAEALEEAGWQTTTEYAYGSLDAPDVIIPTGEDVDDLGSAQYNAQEFWMSVLQRTVKRSPWGVAPDEEHDNPTTGEK